MTEPDLESKGGESRELLIEIRSLIEEARRQTAAAVNIGLTALYWRIGNRIHREVLGKERAAYGEQIVATVSRQLVSDFGRALKRKTCADWLGWSQWPKEDRLAGWHPTDL